MAREKRWSHARDEERGYAFRCELCKRWSNRFAPVFLRYRDLWGLRAHVYEHNRGGWYEKPRRYRVYLRRINSWLAAERCAPA